MECAESVPKAVPGRGCRVKCRAGQAGCVVCVVCRISANNKSHAGETSLPCHDAAVLIHEPRHRIGQGVAGGDGAQHPNHACLDVFRQLLDVKQKVLLVRTLWR